MHDASYATVFHAPVLCHTVLEMLVTDRSGLYVDATLGGGGHCSALLDFLDEAGRVVGLDRDADAIAISKTRLTKEMAVGRLRVLHAAFGDLEACLKSEGIDDVDGVFVDLGVSSHQLDRAARGFSHRQNGALDMRMDVRDTTTAARIVNEWPASVLCKLLRNSGEEPAAARISRAIERARPIRSTVELATVVRRVIPGRLEAKALARVFQAIRIAVNEEMGQLERVLEASGQLVRRGGRMVVISYHSLEDRRVKRIFRFGNLEGEAVRDVYGTSLVPWRELRRRPVRPDSEEAAANPRARSARLRAAQRQ